MIHIILVRKESLLIWIEKKSIQKHLRLNALGSFNFVLIALGSFIVLIYTNTSDWVSEVT